MVNVAADVLAGPLLAKEACMAGVVYSLAYGDRPALNAESVDWARATGFRDAAGNGTKYLLTHHDSTPDGWRCAIRRHESADVKLVARRALDPRKPMGPQAHSLELHHARVFQKPQHWGSGSQVSDASKSARPPAKRDGGIKVAALSRLSANN